MVDNHTNGGEPLKHFQFVENTAVYAASSASQLYEVAKSYAPERVTSLEERLSPIATPIATKALDTSTSLLKFADNKVDQVRTTVNHSHHIRSFNAAKDWAFSTIINTIYLVLDSIRHPFAAAGKAREALDSGIARAAEYADPDLAIRVALDAWARFAAFAPIARALEIAEPTTRCAQHILTSLHDGVVASPLYAGTVAYAASWTNYATTFFPYRLTVRYVYPVVQPIADKVTSSEAVNTFVAYWKPSPPAAH